MIRVSFFIKDIHAGLVLTAMDKIAIDLAMTPVKDKTAGKKTAEKKTSGMNVTGKIREGVAALKVGKTIESSTVRDWLKSWQIPPGNASGILVALQKEKLIKRVGKGKYRRLR